MSTKPGADGRVILMDLNVALSSNFGQMNRRDLARWIATREQYRPHLIPLLRPEHVILITARDARHRDTTLRRIAEQTGWQPQEAVFNDLGIPGLPAEHVKRRLLRTYVYPAHGRPPGQYLAVESNVNSRTMYGAEGIPAVDCDRRDEWLALPTIAPDGRPHYSVRVGTHTAPERPSAAAQEVLF